MRTRAGRAGRAEGPRGLPARLLLLFALLTGVVAMHGLGPGPALAVSGHAAHSGHAASAASAPHAGALTPAAPCACADDGGDGGGHGHHADPTCAAPGTTGAPVLTAPAAAPGTPAAATVAAHGAVPGSAAPGRAPPSLSELQLPRI